MAGMLASSKNMKGIFAAASAVTKKVSGVDLKEPSEQSEFKFNFSVHSEIAAGEGQAKKNKKKKKKKSKSKSNKSETNDGNEDEDSNEDEEHVSVKMKTEESPPSSVAQEEIMMKDLEQLTKQVSSILIETDTVLHSKPSNNGTKADATSTNAALSTTETSGDKKKKKKNNKNKKKSENATTTTAGEKEIDSDDEFLNTLIKSQQEEAAKAAATIKQSKKPTTTTTNNTMNKSPLKQPPGLSIIPKPSGPHFMSPNDPELDPKTKLLAKYGHGKNLVAIGPKKVRDPLWIAPSLPSTTATTSATESIAVVETTTSNNNAVQYHQSPFSFSFGGL